MDNLEIDYKKAADTRLRHSGTDLDTSENDLDTQLRHSDTPKVSLSNKQRDIVNFCSVPRTTAEIMERLGLSNNDATVYNSKAKFTVKEL